MPGISAHVSAATRAAKAIECLRAEEEKKHQQWIATIAFYEALHWIEAVTAALGVRDRPTSHGQRTDLLSTNAKLRPYANPHEKLLNASLIARYLTDDSGVTVEHYFNRSGVLYSILSDWLYKVRAQAKKDLGEAGHAAA